MRKFSADYIYPISSPPIKNGVVVIDTDGIILDVLPSNASNQSSEVESHNGIIIPGFINTHCHLELSYLKDKMPRGKGLDEFIKDMEEVRRNFSKDEILESILRAENEMITNGIVAVGDISNSELSFKQKEQGKLIYHTFIELLGFHPEKAWHAFETGKTLRSIVKAHHSSLTPHSPYAASEKLLALINEEGNETITFHNQESEEENLLFQNKSGLILNRLEKWGIDSSFFNATHTNSLQYILPKLNKTKRILLVHNTYTSKADIEWLKNYESKIKHQEFFFCTCPNANLYIENKLPDYNLFMEENLKITVGTDSLASNDSLSILEELKTISKQFPKIPFEVLLCWATKNGAEFLGMQTNLGTIEKGKKPGLNLLNGINLKQINFGDEMRVEKLM